MIYLPPIFVIITLVFMSCSHNFVERHDENIKQGTYLEEVKELIFDHNKNDTIFYLKNHYWLNDVCDDISRDSTIIYEFHKNNQIDTINGHWFQIIKGKEQLYIKVEENKTLASRQFRLLYMIPPTLEALIVTQRGNK